MKTCTGCKRSLRLSEFNRDSRSRSGVSSRCKICIAAGKKSSYAKHRAQWLREHHEWYVNGGNRKVRDAHLRKKYSITLEEYEALVIAQEGKCRICQNEALLHVDHDHVSGLIRGLLCNPCNLALGMFEDDPNRFLAAATYLAGTGNPR